MFTIDIATLKPGVHTFEFELEAQELDLDPDKFKETRVQARLDVQESRILVLLGVRSTATLECDRTLRLFNQEIEGSHYVLFAPPSFVGSEEDAHGDVRVLDANDEKIDLTDVTRDTLLLAIPQRCVAPGAEEEDIPTAFGAPEDGIDPRWEALKTLKEK